MCQANSTTLDVIHKSATILIALCNLGFAVFIFSKNTQKSDRDKKKDRNIQALKVLIFDHNLKYFYYFFEDIESHLNGFKEIGLSDAEKAVILEKIGDDLILLRRKFTDTLLAIDKSLYTKVLDRFDTFETNINDLVFEHGINLSDAPTFDDNITSNLTILKTETIKDLFDYNS